MIVINRDRSRPLITRHGSEIRPLIDRTTAPVSGCSLAEESLPPGSAVIAHHHLQTEEIYYILSGRGVMSVGYERQTVGAGDAVYIPPGSRHTLENTGQEAMRIVLVCGPAFSHEDEIFDEAIE